MQEYARKTMWEYERKYVEICKKICRSICWNMLKYAQYAKYVSYISQHIMHILHIGNMQNMHYIDSELLFCILFGI